MSETYIYVISASEQGPTKIGYSCDPETRVRKLQTGHANKLRLYYKQAVADHEARKLERQIHTTLGYLRTHGEWFNLNVTDAIAEVQFGLMSASTI